MKSKGIKIAAAGIIIIGVSFLVLNLTIDGIVKSSIEETGTELFQTPVSVGSVDISLFNGSGEIFGLSVANPEDFSDQSAIEMDEIQIKLQLASLLSDTIIVDSVHVKGVTLFFEQEGFGINLMELNENMDLTEDADDPAMVINYFLLENAIVRVSSSLDEERTVESSIENFELYGIGSQNDTTMKQSMQQIMKPLIERAIREATTSGLLDQLQNKIRDLFGGDDD